MIISRLMSLVLAALLAATVLPSKGMAELNLEIKDGVIEPMPFAVPDFVPENAAAAEYAAKLSRVVAADLTGTGLFREINKDAFISTVTNFNSPVQYADWKAINAQALIVGAVNVAGDGRVTVKFRLFDVSSGKQLGQGLQFGAL